MYDLLTQITQILVNPPGNLVYHLVLAFAVVLTLQSSLLGSQRRSNRLLLGLGVILAGQGVLFVTSGLAWQGLANPHLLLPPLERAVSLLSLLWVGWLWLFPKRSTAGDIGLGSLSLLAVIALVLTFTTWSQQDPALFFNNSLLDRVWTLSLMVLALGGLVLMITLRPEGWGTGLGFLGLHLFGAVLQFVMGNTSNDFPGILRLAQLCAYPLLPLINQRPAGQPAPRAENGQPYIEKNRRRFAAEPRAAFAWLQACAQKDPEEIPAVLARAIAQSMLADLVYISSMPDAFGRLNFEGGYDLVREEDQNPVYVEQNSVPGLVNALQRGKALRLEASQNTSPDLKTLAACFNLSQTGNVLFIPVTNSKQSLGGILLLSPYGSRAWDQEDQAYLLNSNEALAQILQRTSSDTPQDSGETSRLREEMSFARSQMEKSRQEIQRLQAELETARQTKPLPSADFEGLLAVQQEAQDTISRLQTENNQLRSRLNSGSILSIGKTSESEEKEPSSELRMALEEISILQNQLKEAQANIEDLQGQLAIELLSKQSIPTATQPLVQAAAPAPNLEEVIQPAGSIIGYADLLLSENDGGLGAMQRKFVEKIKTSAEKIHALAEPAPAPVVQVSAQAPTRGTDFQAAIDEAINTTSSSIQQKFISLVVDIPEHLPPAAFAREPLNEALLLLLQNASQATPPEGNILLSACEIEDDGEPAVRIQIADSGGGVKDEDLPFVLISEQVGLKSIQGIGDLAGVTRAKRLIESEGGKVHVESDSGSTTFSLIVPSLPGD